MNTGQRLKRLLLVVSAPLWFVSGLARGTVDMWANVKDMWCNPDDWEL